MSDLRLPTLEDCQAVVDRLVGGGVRFNDLGPEQRLQVFNAAIQADIADSMAIIADEMRDVGPWFRLSKLWEGR